MFPREARQPFQTTQVAFLDRGRSLHFNPDQMTCRVLDDEVHLELVVVTVVEQLVIVFSHRRVLKQLTENEGLQYATKATAIVLSERATGILST